MLITILIVLLLLVLVLYAIRLAPIDSTISTLIQIGAVMIAILVIARAAGLSL